MKTSKFAFKINWPLTIPIDVWHFFLVRALNPVCSLYQLVLPNLFCFPKFSEKGFCVPTVFLWLLFVYIEASIRLKEFKAHLDLKHLPFHLDLCRPFAAHCIGKKFRKILWLSKDFSYLGQFTLFKHLFFEFHKRFYAGVQKTNM